MNKIPYFERRLTAKDLTPGQLEAVRAYHYAHEYRAPAPTIYDTAIWDQSVPDMVAAFREAGVRVFYIASGFSGMIETLAHFQDAGCVLKQVERIPKWSKYEPDRVVAALRMEVTV